MAVTQMEMVAHSEMLGWDSGRLFAKLATSHMNVVVALEVMYLNDNVVPQGEWILMGYSDFWQSEHAWWEMDIAATMGQSIGL